MKRQLTVKTIRNLNKVNILKTIIKSRSILRSDLSEVNNISVMTVKNVLDDLLQQGIVVEKPLDTDIGRKPRLLQLSPDIDDIVCIDLTSRDFFYYVIYNVYGDIVEKRFIKCNETRSYLANLQGLIERIQEDLKRLQKKALGVGLSVPGAYFEDIDRVNHDLIPEFANIGMRQLFSSAFNTVNVIVGHDVCMAALAESHHLSPDTESLFYFYIGDGVGGAFFHNGQLLLGADLVAGEVGQVLVNTEAGDATFESIVSIPAILQKIREIIPNISFFDALQLYRQGNPEVLPIFESVFGHISRMIYNLVWVLNPKTFVIWSSSKDFAELVTQKALEFAEKLKILPIPANIQICCSYWEEHSALKGLFDMLIDAWIDAV